MDKITKPQFSIITVVKNDEKNIQKTIESILKQTFKNFEYIIIDGKSEDSTLSLINKYKDKINFIISEKDDGIYFAMNKGAKIASGEFVVYVNSGDTLTADALKIIQTKINEKPNIDFVFGTVKRHYTKDTLIKFGFNKKKLIYNFDFATSHSTGFYLRKSKFQELGFFDTKYKCSADYDVYYKMLISNNAEGTFTDKQDLIGEVSSGGYSSKLSFIDHLIEEMRIRFDNKQNFFLIIFIFFNALIKNGLKKIFN
tara:strand:+ start:4138 stop:4902 length:765 start_codon:yes stop_codon:yes gene_type:complete